MKVKVKNIGPKKRGPKGGHVPPNKKSIEQHIKDGTYRRHIHGPKPELQLLEKPKLILPRQHVDTITKKWIRSEADEKAVALGCRFDERYPDYFIRCFTTYLKNSKGKWANQPFVPLDWQANDVLYPMFGWLNPDGTRRYRWVYIEIPKKNGKSTLASAIGIAMLVFDEEPGAEVYSCAADKEQASIVHGEAINMIESSEHLMRLVKINRTNKNVLYKKRKAFYRALSKSIEGKEGYNIHCAICDEIHVWKGREVWDAIRYGFASREQPLCFGITTAGEDKQTICGEQHDYAMGVNNGTIVDKSFLGVIYSADIDKWKEEDEWYKANPSLGHTLNIEEFRSAFSHLQVKPSEENNFKRRRLNIWCTSTKVWIDQNEWKANHADINEDLLRGKFAGVGVDLAKTKDTTSIVFCFPNYDDNGNYYLKPFIFLPEERVKEIEHLITGLREWCKNGDIVLTHGNVADYEAILEHVVNWVNENNINVHSIAFDPYNAEQFTQRLSHQLQCDRFTFGQTISNYAEPTEEFERLVIKGQMHHGNNQMMNWQFSHCLIDTDRGGRTKPVRFSREDVRTIDSCVSAIMGYSRAQCIEEEYYDGAGVW